MENQDSGIITFNKQIFIGVNNRDITNKYEVIQKIGKGGYGIVYELENKITHIKRACKVISKNKINKDFETERDILMKLDHPNIVQIYEVYEDQRFYYLVMEECTGGELFDQILEHIKNKKMYSEKEACILFKQIMLSIAYCHKQGICHRDLKPENLLLSNSDINSSLKIIDFGLSEDFSCSGTNIMKRRVGTAYYVAPEVLNGKYNEKCDIWSAGIILYILLSGIPPFNGKDDNEIYRKILKEKFEYPPKYWSNISNTAIDLINHMLCKQENRYSAKEVLAHPWFELCEKTEFKSINFNLESFQNYVKGNKLKRMVLTYVASRLNEEDIQNLKSEFLNIDKNNDGSISYEELKDVLKKYNLSDENIQKMYRAADTDKDGKINYTEFIASVLDEKTDLREVYLTEAFISFDKDGNHKISKDELMDILKVKEGSNKVKSIEKMINSADKNGDGQIDYQEFLDMFLYQK